MIMKEWLEGLDYNDLLGKVYYGNTLLDYLLVLGSIVLGITLIRFFRRNILKRVKTWTGKTPTRIDNFVVSSVDQYGVPALYVGVVYVSISYLDLSDGANRVFRFILTLLLLSLIHI